MDRLDILKLLESLAQLDIDASRAYGQAIERLQIPRLKENLLRFKADHDRHVVDLSAEIRKLGGYPPLPTPDLKGVFIEGYTAVRSTMGTEGALRAMRTNEMLTTTSYDRALDADLPPEIRRIMEDNYRDEQRHLEFIEEALRAPTRHEPPDWE